MNSNTITEKDRKMAKVCLECPACKRARKKQKGFIFWFVKKIEGGLCPYCKAYEKVYGKKAYEPFHIAN
jgi:transposase-like protein